jgi:transposase-like protein
VEDLMLAIHPQARTTPAVRLEIARSPEPTGVLAKRFGVSTETIRKWRKRGAEDCRDRSSQPHTLPWKATNEERAIVCARLLAVEEVSDLRQDRAGDFSVDLRLARDAEL